VATRWELERLQRESYPEPGVDLPVMFGDLDPNRHVNNVAMGRYFEQGRVTAHAEMRARGAWEAGSTFLIAHVAIDYLAETHFGTPLQLRLRVRAVGRSSITEQQAAWQGDTCVALAEVVVVHRRDGGPAPLPDLLRAGFTALLR